MSPAEGGTRQHSAVWFQLSYDKVSFLWSVWCHVVTLLCILLVISLFKMAPKRSAKRWQAFASTRWL